VAEQRLQELRLVRVARQVLHFVRAWKQAQAWQLHVASRCLTVDLQIYRHPNAWKLLRASW
jgi:hypothetical protein